MRRLVDFIIEQHHEIAVIFVSVCVGLGLLSALYGWGQWVAQPSPFRTPDKRYNECLDIVLHRGGSLADVETMCQHFRAK